MIESKKVWMYSTIGLAAILAVGFSFPQAFAHITSTVPHAFQHILDALAPLQADVDNLQTDVDDLQSSQFTQIVRGVENDNTIGSTICQSDEDYIVNIFVHSTSTANTLIVQFPDPTAGSYFLQFNPENGAVYTIGLNAGEQIEIEGTATGIEAIFAFITLQTKEGAIASCV